MGQSLLGSVRGCSAGVAHAAGPWAVCGEASFVASVSCRPSLNMGFAGLTVTYSRLFSLFVEL